MPVLVATYAQMGAFECCVFFFLFVAIHARLRVKPFCDLIWHGFLILTCALTRERKGQGVEGFQSQAGVCQTRKSSSDQTSHIFFFCVSVRRIIWSPKKKRSCIVRGGLQTRRPNLFFLFWKPQGPGTFLSFFNGKIYFFFQWDLSLVYAPPWPQASKLVTSYGFAFCHAYSGSSYGRKTRLTSPFTLLDGCEMIDPGRHHRA